MTGERVIVGGEQDGVRIDAFGVQRAPDDEGGHWRTGRRMFILRMSVPEPPPVAP